MSPKNLTWKVFLLIVMNDMANSFAQLFMKKGLVPPPENLLDGTALLNFLGTNISSPFMWLGITIYALSFFLWIIVLTRADLSTAMPVASTDYVIIPLLAMIFLKETVTPLRWMGIVSIVAGIYFVSQSGRSGTPERSLL